MKLDRSFFMHIGVLVVAVVFAVFVWTRDKKAAALSQGDVTIWTAHADDVETITFEGKTKTVALEAKKDKKGRYFVGTLEKKPAAADKTKDEDEDDPHGAPHEETEKTGKTTTFVSVGTGNKLAETLATLKALRAVGRIAEDRHKEFGLAEPDATLTVKIRGTERKLLFGGVTPGGADRYARDPGSGEVYAIKGDIYRDLDSADSRLLEKELHEWKDVDVARARVLAGGKKRDLVRSGEDGKKFWADSATADQKDETIGNWMSKLDRLRPSEYVSTPPEQKEVVVRIEYGDTSSDIGFLELVKGPPGASGKADYLLVTERTRLYGKLLASLAEQVEQDVGAVVK
jgi:hypothetical protein